MPPTPIGYAPSPLDAANLAAAVYKSINEAIAAVPDGHTHAIILSANEDKNGPAGNVTFVQKAPEGWNILTNFGYDKTHGFDVGAQLAKSW